MTPIEHQGTFLSYNEIFTRAAVWCSRAEKSLRAYIAEVEAPYSDAMALIADKEHGLALDLADYAKTGPENVLCTRVQYTPDTELPDSARTPGEALLQATQINTLLSGVLQDLADKAAQESLQDVIETLRGDVDHINRQISMVRLTARDI